MKTALSDMPDVELKERVRRALEFVVTSTLRAALNANTDLVSLTLKEPERSAFTGSELDQLLGQLSVAMSAARAANNAWVVAVTRVKEAGSVGLARKKNARAR
jgi:hypothetical protein